MLGFVPCGGHVQRSRKLVPYRFRLQSKTTRDRSYQQSVYPHFTGTAEGRLVRRWPDWLGPS